MDLKIKTVFDYDITDNELNSLHILFKNEEDYIVNLTPYTAYMDLAGLFLNRRDLLKFKLFFNQASESFAESKAMIINKFNLELNKELG